MTSPFVAEIRIFGFNFAPTGWAQCNGALLPISQNTALFSILGTMYGGDGDNTFALPNLRDSVALGAGHGSGLSNRTLGEASGSDAVALLANEIPAHNHGMVVANTVGTLTASHGNQLGKGQKGNPVSGVTQVRKYSANPPTTTLNPATAVGGAGGGLPHNNLMPYLVLNFCIALQGVFPPHQ